MSSRSLPLLAIGAFHGNAATYGVMAAFMAGGAIVGGLIAASRATPRNSSTLAVTALGWGAAITITGLAPNLPIALVALAFVGYGSITFNSTAKTTLQLAARADMRAASWRCGRSPGAAAPFSEAHSSAGSRPSSAAAGGSSSAGSPPPSSAQ